MRIFSFIVVLLFLVPSGAMAEVFMFDAVAVEDRPVMLKARTGGIFFKKGGELVTFAVNEKEIGRTLSGGDGIAYFEYVPDSSGHMKVFVSHGEEKDTGTLLVAGKDEAVVLVGVEQGLSEGEFISFAVRKGAPEAVEIISEKFPVIYISTGPAGPAYDKNWLEENNLPDAPVLEWKSGRLLKKLETLGVRVKAVIGASKLAVKVKDLDDVVVLYFDAESKKDRVRSWDDVLDRLEVK
jgi:hypothetical protein